MKTKIFLIVFAAFIWLCGFALALQQLTMPNTHVTGTIITAAAFNQNNDTVTAVYNRQRDSLEARFARFADFRDSTIDTMKCKYSKVTDSMKTKYAYLSDSLKSAGNIKITTPTTKFYYLGDSMRIGKSGDSLVFHKYTGGAWSKIGGYY